MAKAIELINGRAAFKQFLKTFSFSHTSLENHEFVLKLAVHVNELNLWSFVQAIHVSCFHHNEVNF